ncbi:MULTISPECIES: outer membrane beta-barrel protein [Pseudoalteromonas]|uniref:TonB-dependent receptor n=1 Tax=Pseudoalteromonas amylolytica TaxID=1859457 RepID=A0A1S1MTC8_9GAMM|nr:MULTISPECIES: outer membrane beta-barrel protein [Pseudoalteromonas]OHU86789.1 TonB-dependent receptor [Pseudoalteromonas sp. JW3]OHU88686.1 TonB-dependent receptor [Pseudoalteromonas amylolytica]
MRKFVSITAASMVLAMSGVASAAQGNYFDFNGEPKVYAGIGYGQYSFQWDDRENDTSFDEDESMLKGYIGTALNEYFSVELAYQNFDEASDIDSNAELDGVSLATRFSAPLSNRFSLYAKGGWLEWNADIYANIPEVGRVGTELDGGDWFYGAGVAFVVTNNVNMRLEYERYELDDRIDPNMDVASLSVEYVF